MPDDTDIDESPEAEEARNDPNAPKWYRDDLQRQAAAAKKARTEASDARRELGLLKAGVDTTTPLGEFFASKLRGDESPDDIAAQWLKLNPAPATPPEPVDQVAPEHRAVQEAAQALRTGEPLPPTSLDSKALTDGIEARARTGQLDEGVAAWLRTKQQENQAAAQR